VLNFQLDANKWGEIAKGWSYNDVLPFYKKSENATGSPVAFNTAYLHFLLNSTHVVVSMSLIECRYHGYKGPIQLAGTNLNDPSTPLWIETLNSYGVPNNSDFNGATRFGVGFQITSIQMIQNCWFLSFEIIR
jgi:choline dehydrogenase-like flavoprotein